MSQADTMLELLRDGRWHSTVELAHAGVGRPNNRKRDLEKKGYSIEARRQPGVAGAAAYQYRLEASPSPVRLAAAPPPTDLPAVPDVMSENDVVALLASHGLVEWIETEPLFDLGAAI